jgi:hypothetical protein
MTDGRWDLSRLANIASAMRVTVKRLGWPHTLLWSCAALGRRFSMKIFVVTLHPFQQDVAHDDASTAGLQSRLLSRDDVVRYFDRADGLCYSREFALEALSRGDRCFGLFENERLLWYCWYARDSAPAHDDVDAVADFPFLYAYNAHTDAAHRGRGLHRRGVKASARFFAREGYRAFTAYIEAHNLAPLIAARTMAEPAVGLVGLYSAAGRVRWFATPGCRRAGFRILRRPIEASLRRSADEDRRAPA